MSEIETNIFRALTDKLMEFVTANPIGLSVPNASFTPGNDPYLEVSYLPAETIPLGLDTLNQHVGIFQIDCVWPDGFGIHPAIEKAGELIRHFKRNTRMNREGVVVRVNRAWHSGSQPLAAKWIKVPVSIRYEAFV